MLSSVEGIYRNGKIEISELPANVRDETRVIVTFMPNGDVDLNARGIDQTQAAELRVKLAAFAEDWESPEMNVYDNYGAAKSEPQAR